MASVTIRNVPDEARDELAARAALTGRSLQGRAYGTSAIGSSADTDGRTTMTSYRVRHP